MMEHKLSAFAKQMKTKWQLKNKEDLSESYLKENGWKIAHEEGIIYEE